MNKKSLYERGFEMCNSINKREIQTLKDEIEILRIGIKIWQDLYMQEKDKNTKTNEGSF